MYAYDFEYDGKLLSEYGFMVCRFDEAGGPEAADAGSEITFVTAPMQAGKRFVAGGSKYDKCLTTTFQICKNPCDFNAEEMEISADEFRALSRWLNRREFLWFHNYDWQEPEKIRPWVRASFSLAKIEIGGVTYGIELTMTTDSPFGYGEEIVEEFTFTQNKLSELLVDYNDEIGETYPALTITCGSAGTLTISDDRTDCECSVDNCISGEVISFSGDTQIITSSNALHDLANDFNYDFFRFGNTFDDRENTVTVNMPCTVELRYRPIWKDTL